MLPLKERIYNACPVFFQNILVSLYGLKLYLERYNKSASSSLKRLMKSQWDSEEDINKLQEREFIKLAHNAIKYVPFYRDWAIKNNIKQSDISSLLDLSRFPILEKYQLRKKPEQFVDERFLRAKSTFSLSTSGTTGTPLTLYCDNNSRTRHYAFWSRLRYWFGVGSRGKRATLFGRVIMPATNNSPPFWRYDWPQNNLLMSSYHLSNENMEHYYNKLQTFKPEELVGYPSSLYLIAKHIVKNNKQALSFKVVITTAETLLPHHREVMEKAFSAPIIDQYGCTEMALFVSQCEHGGMHIHPEHGIVEVVNKDGSATEKDCEGEVVCTGLINNIMPLIRYRLGDRISLSSETCNCNRHFPLVSEIGGRIDDVLITPSGRNIGRMDPIFKGRSGIYETQIIQLSKNALQFNMVTDPRLFDDTAKRGLISEIKKRIGEDMEIKLRQVNNIKKDNNGKFKSVISTIA